MPKSDAAKVTFWEEWNASLPNSTNPILAFDGTKLFFHRAWRSAVRSKLKSLIFAADTQVKT